MGFRKNLSHSGREALGIWASGITGHIGQVKRANGVAHQSIKWALVLKVWPDNAVTSGTESIMRRSLILEPQGSILGREISLSALTSLMCLVGFLSSTFLPLEGLPSNWITRIADGPTPGLYMLYRLASATAPIFRPFSHPTPNQTSLNSS
ncbi:uncharacterized protein BT62DRAFT_1075514 [Guyanagaster necrorhizus]|uniref:Uncharacterized protein n=1 Tax=Guyanagaster necrorhizus TaxID=856835 RepID=A0A9P7VTU0_9AGAR|nr:uncharacterized protein BT62DRAFT_1075514 [Guyanagaster necrorhizus MCA 3950]KAG7446747.1 hypothetical protein BT62DRAFT_1075514 [Guyanagaster necrorhizus MCA 3950]